MYTITMAKPDSPPISIVRLNRLSSMDAGLEGSAVGIVLVTLSFEGGCVFVTSPTASGWKARWE
jgi:hypothetical protein